MENHLLAAAQSHLQVLADQLEERGDQRHATVRRLGLDLLAFVAEFERLQELEMVAGDVLRDLQDISVTGMSDVMCVESFRRLRHFLKANPATAG